MRYFSDVNAAELESIKQLFKEVPHHRSLHVELVSEVGEQLHLAHASGVSHVETPLRVRNRRVS
jgi:hypothetical protein